MFAINREFVAKYVLKNETIISELPQIEPMVIAIWCGNGKPSVLNDFLDTFVNELNEIVQNGISVNGFEISVAIRCFICDTPARAYIKGMPLMLYFSHFSYMKNRFRSNILLTNNDMSQLSLRVQAQLGITATMGARSVWHRAFGVDLNLKFAFHVLSQLIGREKPSCEMMNVFGIGFNQNIIMQIQLSKNCQLI